MLIKLQKSYFPRNLIRTSPTNNKPARTYCRVSGLEVRIRYFLINIILQCTGPVKLLNDCKWYLLLKVHNKSSVSILRCVIPVVLLIQHKLCIYFKIYVPSKHNKQYVEVVSQCNIHKICTKQLHVSALYTLSLDAFSTVDNHRPNLSHRTYVHRQGIDTETPTRGYDIRTSAFPAT
jgi:hypothetical protein